MGDQPCPGASPSDGMWHILVLRANGTRVSRASILKTLLGLERTTPWPADAPIEMIKCKAFRLTPQQSTTGHLAIDGESLPFGTVQVWPLPWRGVVFGGGPENDGKIAPATKS